MRRSISSQTVCRSRSDRSSSTRGLTASLWLGLFLGLPCVVGLTGCGGSSTSKPVSGPAKKQIASPAQTTAQAAGDTADSTLTTSPGDQPAKKKKPKFEPIDLNASSGDAASGSGAPSKANISAEEWTSTVVAQLQPFQVLLGKWNWTTKKQFGGFAKHGEDLKWVWDFRSDRKQPALVFETESHPYFATGSLTYLPDESKFRLKTLSPDKEAREFVGTWTEDGEPREEHDGKKTQRTYKLELNQTQPAEGEQWKVFISQLDNDQYQVQMTKRPAGGANYTALDVVRQQRQGTSFAVADSDNPGPKCVVSGGLGNATVTYQGKSYPVCCTGCAAAFNDDPERWLAKMAATMKPQ